jgi:hypothetical protein
MDLSLMDALRAHTEQMSSLYARATPQRETEKPSSRPAAGFLVVYIYYPQKIPPPEEASDRPARAMRLCPSSRRTWLHTRSRSLPLGGFQATIIIIKIFYPSGPVQTLTLLYTIFAIPPPASFRMDHSEKKGSQQHACFCRLWLMQQNRTHMSDDWHLVEGFTVAGHCSNLLSEAQRSSVYSL